MPQAQRNRGPYTPPQAYVDLVAQGSEPHHAGMTFEWRCRACDTVTYCDEAGGKLNHGTCEPACKGEDLEIYRIFAGHRDYWATAAEFGRDAF